MRIVFIGQAPFGREALEALLDQGEAVVGAITVEDRPGQKHPNPVKECARSRGIDLLQTDSYKTDAALAWVRQRRPDLLVLAFVTAIVPKAMIDCARRGGINFHPSLLPKYRGGSAINWAIINGETETGVTIHWIDEGIDTGPILVQERVAIEPEDTVKSVYFDKLYPLGLRLIAEAVRLIRENRAPAVAQDEAQASFQPVITDRDTIIDWSRPTAAVYNLIRGANPSPGAVTSLQGATCKIFDARIGNGQGAPGTVLAADEESFTVATGDGAVAVLTAQQPGEKKLPAAELRRRIGFAEGARFGT